MKFLTFVDLHEDSKFLKKLVERIEKSDIDFVVCAGDLTVFSRSLRYVLKHLNDTGKKIYLIPGNHESDELFENVLLDYPNIINFNQQALRLGNYVFLGYGEGGFVTEDQDFRKLAREWYGKYKNEKTILVTHGPPYGTKADFVENRYVGNRDFRAFIERIEPKLAICGHIHENAGKVDSVGKTKIINPGWEGLVIELS
jgi:Icc-related predicted phosphoesterase